MSEAAEWDVRDLLDAARKAQAAEDDWLAQHAGALSASQLGGCLRREKLRLLGAPAANEPTPQMLRRWRWGRIYQDEVYRQALAQNRRPRREVPVEVEVEGVQIVGHADLLFSEAVVEVKTTSAWEMHADHLPFQHLMQTGTYMYALNRPGQLLYGSFHREWSFDLPTLPEMWEPWVRGVADLFAANPGEDVRPYPPERLYCDTCPYVAACPSEAIVESARPLTALETEIVERYLAIRAEATAAGKREDEAKARLLGLKEQRGSDERGVCRLTLPGRAIIIRESQQERVDYTALDAKIKDGLPRKTITVTTIKEERNE